MKRLTLSLLLFAALPILSFGQSQNLITGAISSSGSTCQPGGTYTNCVIAAIPSGATAPPQSVGVTITGTFSGTLQFEISLDNGANWSAVNATPPNSTSAVTSTTSTGFWAISAAGGSHVRVRASALASGSATASINPSQAIVPSAGGGGGSGLSGMTGGQIPVAATASTVTSSKAIQGTDANLLSSGTISGTAATLCTDANGGATTSGCGSGFSPTTFQSSAVTTNIAAANIVASAGSTKLYHFDWEVSLTVVGASCTGSTTVVVNAVLTDPNTSSPQTVALGTITVASLGNGTLGYVADGSESFYVKTGTALQYSTTSYTAGSGCVTNPTYQVTGEVF